MGQPETVEIAGVEPGEARASAASSETAAIGLAHRREAQFGRGAAPAQAAPAPCPTCGGDGVEGVTTSYVYSLGQIEARFPRPSIEKEMAQATGRSETAGRTEQQTLHQVLSQRENRYLARQMCWVLTIQGLETYILQPRDPADVDLLVGAIEPQEHPSISTVIGVRGPIAAPDHCNGLMVPIVFFDQIYTFSREALIGAIPRPDSIPAEQFGPAARELFDTIMTRTDNAGATDGDRALNYLAVRYPRIYARAAEAFAGNFGLTGAEIRSSPLSGTRNIVEVIFSFTHRTTGYPEKYFVRVDVTEEFPFLVTKMSPYYDWSNA